MTTGKAVYIMVLATALGLAVVRQAACLREAGYRQAELRGQIAEVREDRLVLDAHLAKLRSPQRILALTERLGLNLARRPFPESTVQPDEAVEVAAAPTPEGPADGGAGETIFAAVDRY